MSDHAARGSIADKAHLLRGEEQNSGGGNGRGDESTARERKDLLKKNSQSSEHRDVSADVDHAGERGRRTTVKMPLAPRSIMSTGHILWCPSSCGPLPSVSD